MKLDDYNIESNTSFHTPVNDTFHEKLLTVKLDIPNEEPPWSVFFAAYSEALSQLGIQKDRIEHLVMLTETLSPQICKFIEKCVNLKTLKFDTILGADPDLFIGAPWIDSARNKFLSHLEVTMNFRNILYHDSTIGLSAIQPFLKECKDLITIKVLYIRLSSRLQFSIEKIKTLIRKPKFVSH